MNEQAAALQEYIRRSHLNRLIAAKQSTDTRHATVITITSGKGGVGKSMLSLNLALSSSEKTVVIDGDLLLGNLGILTNLQASTSWSDLLLQREKWSKHLKSLNQSTDLLIGTPFDSEQKLRTVLTSGRLIGFLNALKSHYDLIIIDTASGLSSAVIEWCMIASQIIIVTTPDPAAITDGYALMKSLALTEIPFQIGVVVNQCTEQDDPEHIAQQLKIMGMEFLETSITSLGYIPWKSEIMQASRSQVPTMLSEDAEMLAPFLNQLRRRIPGTHQQHKYELTHTG